MAHTSHSSELGNAIFNLIEANKISLGLADVFFGEQKMLPRSPAAVVDLGRKRRELAGVSAPGGRTMNNMDIIIDVHSAKVAEEALARMELNLLAEAVEDLLHVDTTMGGIIIHGFVRDWDPGEAFINNSMFRTVRMMYTGQTKTYLSPMP